MLELQAVPRKGQNRRLQFPDGLQPRAGPHFERVFEQITDERSAAVQEYIDNLRAFAAQQDNALRLLKSNRKSKRLPNARTSCSTSRLRVRSPTTSSNSATRPATSSLPPSSSSEQNYRTQTRHWKNVSDGWKICAASSRNGGR